MADQGSIFRVCACMYVCVWGGGGQTSDNMGCVCVWGGGLWARPVHHHPHLFLKDRQQMISLILYNVAVICKWLYLISACIYVRCLDTCIYMYLI